jgi:predicted DNA-binding protein (MmcQ/YjbR family)
MTSQYPRVDLPDHPFAAGLQRFCLGFEGAYEDYPWGEVVYKTREKLFAMLGGSAERLSVTLKASPEDAGALAQLPHIERAAYVGRYGWVTVSITDPLTLDHARDLIAESYRLVVSRSGRGRRGGKLP